MTNYEKYQLDWMIEHGFSISDLINSLSELGYDSEPNVTVENLFYEWMSNTGFNGEIWACKDEWEDYEGSGKDTDAPYDPNADIAEWIEDYNHDIIYCSFCKSEPYRDEYWGYQLSDNCPNCGAKMEN